MEENWVKQYWRPAVAWHYLAVCIYDFLLGPLFASIMGAINQVPVATWVPITLGGAGLYHMAMGAIIGIAAWTRGQEKIQKIIEGVK